jgi:fatty-acyl-CoA synthase
VDIGYLTRHSTWDLRSTDPDRPAVSLEDRETLTYRELHARSTAFANALLARGVRPGDRVGALLYNSLDYWVAYLGTTRIGAILVRLNFRLTTAELGYILGDSDPVVMCVDPPLVERVAPLRDELGARHWVVTGDGTDQPDWLEPWARFEGADTSEPQVARPTSEMPAVIMYTSGTTGLPKGAVWTHANTMWFDTMQAVRFGFTRDSVAMVTGPMYHGGAVEDWTTAVMAVGGHAIVIRSGGFDIRRVLEVIAAQQVDHVLLFPFMIYEMLALPDLESFDLSSLRRIMSGGDPLLPWAVERIRELYPQIDITQVFGLTEGGAISTSTSREHSLAYPDSVGVPMPFTEVSLRDDDGTEGPVGEVGEIWVRSPGVSPMYWNKPEASAETFVDGWCRTGDLGRINEGGLLVIAGRKKDMIRSGGENIYPAEIEDVLCRHELIREAAAVAVPDERWIESVCAVVVPVEGAELTEEDVKAHCAGLLAGYKRPRYVVIADSLPRNPSGKVLKKDIREQVKDLPSRLPAKD